MPKRFSPTSALPVPKITFVRFVERDAPFDDPHFIFGLKYDGVRALAYIEQGTAARLVSRSGMAHHLAIENGVGHLHRRCASLMSNSFEAVARTRCGRRRSRFIICS